MAEVDVEGVDLPPATAFPAAPDRRYGAICADPPWKYVTWSEKGAGRAPDAHYECVPYDALAALPVADWAAEDCALFLWVVDPLLDKGIELMRSWGFTFKTVAFYWAKTRKLAPEHGPWTERDFHFGNGYWTRANPEQCLLGTRGRPKRLARDVRRFLPAKLREHSRKPDEAYRRIVRLVGGPYLEMFSRVTRPGWDAWGDQAGLFDAGDVATRRFPSGRPDGAADAPP